MTDSFSNSVSIIIPTLNEEENILPLVAEIAACAVPFREILFVDVPIVFRERVYGKSKMSFNVALRFFSRWLHAMVEHLVRSAPRHERSASVPGAEEALHPEAPGE
jgi:hypothetical protein